MSRAPVLQAASLIQALGLFGLVLVFLNPRARWSVRARLPVALLAFVGSATHLLLTIL